MLTFIVARKARKQLTQRYEEGGSVPMKEVPPLEGR